MITYKTVHCRGFVLCVGSGLQGGTLTQPNVGNGFAMQYVYVYKGHGEITDGESMDVLPNRELTNIAKYMGREVSFKVLGDPTMWVAINPAFEGDRFDAKLLTGSTTVEGSDKRQYIVCLEGSVQCNDKTLQALMYAPVRSTASVSVSIPQDSVAVVLTTV